MNEMWAEMSDQSRDEYKDFFVAYHDSVAKSGFTGKRIKPVTVLPRSVMAGLEKALLTKVSFLVGHALSTCLACNRLPIWPQVQTNERMTDRGAWLN